MYLRKSNMCYHKLDVQEANVSVSRFYRISNCFLGCWCANGRNSHSRSWDVVIEVLRSSKNTHQAVRDHCQKVHDQVLGNRARGEIGSTNPKTKLKRSRIRDVDELSIMDHAVTNASSSQFAFSVRFLKMMNQ